MPNIRPLVAMNGSKNLKWFAEVGPQIEFVDLGLTSGTKWAKYNVGATYGDSAASWYGNYFQWGSTTVADERTCSWADCPNTNGTYSKSNKKVFTKYIPISQEATYWNGTGAADNLLTLELTDDPANAVLGGEWHSPSKAQIEELFELTNEWVTNYNGVTGLNGRLFHGVNNTELFFPAAGYRYYGSFIDQGSYGRIWSSSLNTLNPAGAHDLGVYDEVAQLRNDYRYYGYSVRGVLG